MAKLGFRLQGGRIYYGNADESGIDGDDVKQLAAVEQSDGCNGADRNTCRWQTFANDDGDACMHTYVTFT